MQSSRSPLRPGPLALSPTDAAAVGQQRLRLRRVLLAVGIYLPCALLLGVVSWLGFLPGWFVPAWALLFGGTNLVFIALIRSGANLRLKDPSMTMAQMAVAILAVAMILYHAQAARGVLLMFLPVILFFGVLRLRTAEVLVMGALASAAHVAVIVLLAHRRPGEIDLRLEWLQWIVVTATLAALGPFVGYLGGLRRRLGESMRTIREMAQRDALTGLYNRHHLNDTLEREIARCARGAPPFLLAVADVDHFKRVNDTHGHLVGDQVLRGVAQQLQACLRRGDYLARFGGEEFVLLMTADSAEAGRVACDRLRRAVEQLRLQALDGQGLTVSIGAAMCRPQDSAGALLQRADAALYRVKNAGRNRVEVDH